MSEAWLESRTVEANGQRIHLKIAEGSGPLVLFCHGFPESWLSWRHQLLALSSAGYRAVAMDMRGYGRSAKPTDPRAYRNAELVADCVGVVEALGEASAVIVGHDLGAPVAWAGAWTRPDIFRAVVGLSLPFGGRGLACLPGSPFGELRPAEAASQLTGPDLILYSQSFTQSGDVVLREAERDLGSWLLSALYSLSADRPLPAELAGVDLTALPPDALVGFIRAAMCVPRSASFNTTLLLPDALPAWLSQDTLDRSIAELEYSGLVGPLNYYRNAEEDWDALGEFAGRPITVPALFIGGDRDVVTIWAQEAIRRADEVFTDLRGRIIVPDCGHWIQQEKPDAVNAALLTFLSTLENPPAASGDIQ